MEPNNYLDPEPLNDNETEGVEGSKSELSENPTEQSIDHPEHFIETQMAESVTSETSSHKMKIDEITTEDDQPMEVENNSKINSSKNILIHHITFFIMCVLFRCKSFKHFLCNK